MDKISVLGLLIGIAAIVGGAIAVVAGLGVLSAKLLKARARS